MKERLKDFEKEVARLKTLDRPGARGITDDAILKRLSLSASLNLSIKRLPEKQQHNFIWLGVLPEDITITPVMMGTLWDMDDVRDASDELRYFGSKALLLPGVLMNGVPTYRLHDLFHDLARNLLEAPIQPSRTGDLPGLGISFNDAHAKFLEKYQKKTKNGLWHTLPQDGYIQENLVWHLEKANHIEEIHRLLQEETLDRDKNRINAWYEVRDKLGQVAGYLTDVVRAWELIEANWDEASLPSVVGLQCRYALIIGSINAFAAIYPEKLFFVLIKKNVWTPEEGLFYALRVPEPNQKARRLIALTDYLPENLKAKALEEVKATEYSSQDELNFNHSNSNYIYLIIELLRFNQLKRKKGKLALLLKK